MTQNQATVSGSWLEKMRRDWNARARENARYYICTDIPSGDEAFFDSGRDDFERLIAPCFAEHNFDPRGKVALEIGCGIGRLARWAAARFGEVIGIDVSEEMIKMAQQYGWPRTRFVNGNGRDLAGIPDASIDFVYSYIVFQHIPDPSAILGYIREIGRVLRRAGMYCIHLNGLPHVRIGGVLLEGYISHSPRLRRLGIRALPFVRRRRLDTWLGHPISIGEIRKSSSGTNLEVLSVRGRWSENMWVTGRKNA